MSSNRLIGLGAVVLIHIFLGYALVTGLAQKFVKKIIAPIEAVQVKDKVVLPDEPPPPPPKEQEIPPYVPPPEVTVQNDSPAPPTISTQSVAPPPPVAYVAPPAPPRAEPPPAPPAGPTQHATANPRVFEVSEDDYPPSSIRAEEEGITTVSVNIDANGRVSGCTVTTSSNFPKLDERTCKIAQSRWRFKPALLNGAPTTDTISKRIRWQINRK